MTQQSKTRRIMGRKNRLTNVERRTFDKIFQSGGGYVLDFSDASMGEWFEEYHNINIFHERFQITGKSKGKCLRGFVEVADPRLVARVLRELWEYRCTRNLIERDPVEEDSLSQWLQQFTEELENSPSVDLQEAFRDFTDDTTLKRLQESIANDLAAEKPDAAIDRIHTYCVKRFRALLRERGDEVSADMPLHSIFGRYGKSLRDDDSITEFTLPILRSVHKLVEALNDARNKRSLAHDNELLSLSEARFFVDSVVAALCFIERTEENRKKPSAAPADDIDEIPF